LNISAKNPFIAPPPTPPSAFSVAARAGRLQGKSLHCPPRQAILMAQLDVINRDHEYLWLASEKGRKAQADEIDGKGVYNKRGLWGC